MAKNTAFEPKNILWNNGTKSLNSAIELSYIIMLYNNVSLVMLTIFMTAILSRTSAQEKSISQKEVETATEMLTQALLKPSPATLNRLTSDKLSYGHSSGKVETKEQFVQTLMSGASVFEEIQLSDQTADVQENTAVVRHVLNAKTNDPGKGPANIRIGIILTWVKSDGNWQLLARQAFKL